MPPKANRLQMNLARTAKKRTVGTKFGLQNDKAEHRAIEKLERGRMQKRPVEQSCQKTSLF